MNSGPDRKLTVILCADVCGYSRLMSKNESATLERLKSTRDIFRSYFEEYGGRIVNMAGDGLVGEFSSAVKAVQCAIMIQERINAEEANVPADRRMLYRIGINIGDVIIEGDDLFGGGVNVAARLEALAPVGGINISGAVYEQVRTNLPQKFEFRGERSVKNISVPVAVYALAPDGETLAPEPEQDIDQPSTAEEKMGAADKEDARIRAYVRRQASFYRRAMMFGGIIFFLFIINMATVPDYWWFLWPAGGMLLALAMDAVRTFSRGHRMHDWEDRKFQEIKNRRHGGGNR